MKKSKFLFIAAFIAVAATAVLAENPHCNNHQHNVGGKNCAFCSHHPVVCVVGNDTVAPSVLSNIKPEEIAKMSTKKGKTVDTLFLELKSVK